MCFRTAFAGRLSSRVHTGHRRGTTRAQLPAATATTATGATAGDGRAFKFAEGARVQHVLRGAGVVTELMADGRTRIRFDDGGEEHRYRPSSMHKISALGGSSSAAAGLPPTEVRM